MYHFEGAGGGALPLMHYSLWMLSYPNGAFGKKRSPRSLLPPPRHLITACRGSGPPAEEVVLTFGGSGPPAEETSLGHPPRVGAPNIFFSFFSALFRLPITMPKIFLLFFI